MTFGRGHCSAIHCRRSATRRDASPSHRVSSLSNAIATRCYVCASHRPSIPSQCRAELDPAVPLPILTPLIHASALLHLALTPPYDATRFIAIAYSAELFIAYAILRFTKPLPRTCLSAVPIPNLASPCKACTMRLNSKLCQRATRPFPASPSQRIGQHFSSGPAQH